MLLLSNYEKLVDRLADWLIDWLIDRLIDWSIGWLIVIGNYCSKEWHVNCLIDWLADWLSLVIRIMLRQVADPTTTTRLLVQMMILNNPSHHRLTWLVSVQRQHSTRHIVSWFTAVLSAFIESRWIGLKVSRWGLPLDWWIDWLSAWLIDWLIHWSID